MRRSAERAVPSGADSVTVVTGYRHEEIEAALARLDLDLAHNPDFASGMASSLKQGFGARNSPCRWRFGDACRHAECHRR
ncbi:NTP transferase domain-containing protein [Rhizobium ruizarguesonis]